MMQSLVIAVWLGLVTESTGMSAIVGMNMSHLRGGGSESSDSAVGKNSCRCIGIDNMKGYYATQVNFHHVQYPAETGASCNAWDKGGHPECKGKLPPQWCDQKWCYVDPCSCELDVLPKQSEAGVKYQGNAAYWSYVTCGGTDFFSSEKKGACVNQKSQGECDQESKCAWDGKQCGGKEVVETCKAAEKKDAAVHGEEDCRCVGLDGRDVGKAFMHINEKDMVAYSANVGSTCSAWESDVHPDCLKDGEKPAWCDAKWCFVDPCKCKTKVAPKAVADYNGAMRFQGKTSYWSYATCGSKDSWSTDQKGEYCPTQKSEAACSKLSKCSWNGKECLGKALVEICAKQEETGILGVEAPLPEALQSSALSLVPLKTLLVLLGVVGVAN